MKKQTAIKQIEKEMNFLGKSWNEVLALIEKNGRGMFSEKTLEAFKVLSQDYQKTDEAFTVVSSFILKGIAS